MSACACSVAQLCPALCDCSPPGSSVHGISPARILEWVDISLSRVSFQVKDQTRISCVSCIGRQIKESESSDKAYILLEEMFF